MWAHPGIAIFYGCAFWVMAVILGAVFLSSPEYTMTVASGCLLVGPFLAMGLYDVSRRRERGGLPTLGGSLTCWDAHLGSMGMLAYAFVGGAFATIVFAVAVVSIPIILDRDVDAISAAITSLQVVFGNVVVMVVWAFLIASLVAGALLLPWGCGLLLVGPWLGHASWHAYRGAVHWHSLQ